MNTLTLNKVLLNARPLNMRKRIVKDKDFYYKVLDREFSFSITAGGKRIKSSTATISRLKGNSVVWNQRTNSSVNSATKTENGVTFTKNEDGSFSVVTDSAGATANTYIQIGNGISVINTHKYILYGAAQGGRYETYNAYATNGFASAIYDYGAGAFGTSTGGKTYVVIMVKSGQVISSPLKFSMKLIDLTQMFGSGNEPTTIEEFNARKPIVEDEYAYNEGEVIHMTAEGIKSVGDNAFNGEYAKVIGNEEYYFGGTYTSLQYAETYDGDRQDITLSNSRYTPAKGGYVFATGTDIMITLVHSGWKQDTDANYQPYWEDNLVFDQRIKDEFPNGMKKWDMVYNKNGKGYIVKGTGVVKMKDLNWIIYSESTEVYYAVLPSDALVGCQLIGNKYSVVDWINPIFAPDKVMMSRPSYAWVYIRDSAYTDVASFVASLTDDDILIYQLAEPTIIEYDEPFNLDYRVADFGTEQAIAEQPSAPISAEIGYHILKNNLELTLNS